MLRAGVTELRKAYIAHSGGAAVAPGTSARLLRFYAIECGLKSMVLVNRGLRRTDQPGFSGFGTHNLRTLVRELRLPRTLAGGLINFRTQRDAAERYGPEKAHEAWRYGVRIESSDENELDRALVQLDEHLKKAV